MRIDIAVWLIFSIQPGQQLKQQHVLHNIGKVACMDMVTVIHVSTIPDINGYFSMKNSFIPMLILL